MTLYRPVGCGTIRSGDDDNGKFSKKALGHVLRGEGMGALSVAQLIV